MLFFITSLFLLGAFLFPKLVDADNQDGVFISYDHVSGTLTNQDVTASLEGLTTGTVLNNGGLTGYVFTGNGSFVFEYDMGMGSGVQYLTATVDWIDKTPPTATIQYSTTSASPQPVIATLIDISEAVTITNVTGGLTGVTFTGNGDFTFIFQDTAGNIGTATATVNRILSYPADTQCAGNDLRLTHPTAEQIVGGDITIAWNTNNSDCHDQIAIDIQLYDHNQQRITIDSTTVGQGEYEFDSLLLAYTGLYTITGVHLSGAEYTGLDMSGNVITGQYTQDIEYVVYTGAYTGAYTGYASGYMIRLVDATNANLLANTVSFTIDNTSPQASVLTSTVNNTTGGTAGTASNMILTLHSNEQLHNFVYIVNGTQIAASATQDAQGEYILTIPLEYVQYTGAITYDILATDMAGNQTSIEGALATVFDPFATTQSSSNSNTNNTSSSATSSQSSSASSASSNPTPSASSQANPAVAKIAQNITPKVEQNIIKQILKQQVSDFNECKENLKTQKVSLQTKNNKTIEFNLPSFKKNSLKLVSNSFLGILFAKLEKMDLADTHIAELSRRTDNFFLVLKAMRDNDNSFDCDQNLSAYYIRQFAEMISALGLLKN